MRDRGRYIYTPTAVTLAKNPELKSMSVTPNGVICVSPMTLQITDSLDILFHEEDEHNNNTEEIDNVDINCDVEIIENINNVIDSSQLNECLTNDTSAVEKHIQRIYTMLVIVLFGCSNAL